MNTPFVAAVTISFLSYAGCNSQKSLEEKLVQKEAENTRLMEEMNQRDQYIGEVTEAINDVQDNLRSIAIREHAVRSMKQDIELSAAANQLQKNQISSDISAIKSIISESKSRILQLQERLSSNKTHIASLENTILKLTETVNEKENEILDLKNELQRLNILVSEKEKQLKESETTISRSSDSLRVFQYKMQEAQQVYYAIGTEDELISKGIIKKQGGNFLGGKVLVPNENISLDMFARVNSADLSILSIEKPFKRIALVTPHNDRSYTLSPDRGLLITNKEQFWGLTRVAVILVEK